MVLLKDGVYCKHRILETAQGASHKASHLVRRLLQEVFKPEIILKSTVSGRTPRAQGKERQCESVIPLNSTAKNAIIGIMLIISAVSHICYLIKCFTLHYGTQYF